MTQKPNKKSHQHVERTAPSKTSWLTTIKHNKGWLAGGSGAAALAALALFNRASAKRAEADYPPTGDFVEVDGVRLHYVDRGEGPAVVLLHGNGVMLQDFELSGVLELAAEHHRVIAFDRPGFGYSDRPRSKVWTAAAQADLIAKALKQIGVGPAIVVGHSWGTLVALAMALEHREATAGLVLLSGYYYGTARPDVVPSSIPAIPVLGDLIASTTAPLTALLIGPAAVKASFAPAQISEKFASFPKSMALRPSQVRATAADTAMMIPSAMALSKRYAELDLPVIIMAGEGDLIAHVGKHSERLVGEVGGAELRMVAEQGHLFHYKVPEQVVTAIADARRSA
ncbi:alpha/beta fold hydrolase [Sphingomonas xinjiangensis]|uniref:Pimeloyl-ACP methyl ester carboxylesterase n=1 Tax=Sphingomonas xinjiangensis TaxID=643568 RepID=A0A840YT80_9SPHN|nr:alpha/beta hydrolase [Sphingomonas xinjiangensis]MBB5712921.1 pimeloyl-ACP methyl ester carboxylesterase [Sphingomonas xinjiangensis]